LLIRYDLLKHYGMITMNKYLSQLLIGLLLLSSTGTVTASTVYGEIPTAIANMSGGAENKNDKENDLNADIGYFGVTGWTEVVKVDSPKTSNTGDYATLVLTYEDNKNGTWSFDDNPWESFNSLLIVLKGGRSGKGNSSDPADAVFWTASLISTDTLSGTWEMTSKDLSHMTVYGTNELLTLSSGIQVAPSSVNLSAVPVPAAVWLFASALLGLTSISRQRKA